MGMPTPPKLTDRTKSFLQTKHALPMWLLIVGVILACALGRATGTSADITTTAIATATTATQHTVAAKAVATSIPTATRVPATATPVPTLKTIASYSGTGTKNTADFHITADQWQIAWACQPGGFGGNLSVEVDQSDGTYVDLAVNEICSSSLHDMTIERGSGDYYLKISADAPWQIQVQAVQ